MQFHGVYLEERLPIIWRSLACSVFSSEERNLTNLEHLRVISSLDDYYAPSLDIDESSSISQEFQRLDTKLNVVMQMLGRLLVRDSQLPLAQPVVLQLDKLHWQPGEPDVLKVGDQVEIELYLKRNFPFALTLSAVVDQLEGGWVSACIDTDHDEVSELMEKYIFRSHRRQVAKHKKPHS